MTPPICSQTMTDAALPQGTDFNELFEGSEKTLTLCFKSRRLQQSLRLTPQSAWEEVLKFARCEILSVVESTPVNAVTSKKGKVVATNGVTAYLLSESSLFVSDTSLVLKTCGKTTPLAALEPLLELAVPDWKQHDSEYYLKYATFMRLGYDRPEEQPEPHSSWSEEVKHMDKYFIGEGVTLGTEGVGAQHIYVANYLRKDEVVDYFSTQVALTQLDTFDALRRYAAPPGGQPPADMEPLRSAWPELHCDERRSVAAKAVFDERFFEPVGYSSNATFGRHYTTIHATPQPSCSYMSVETSAPMTREARARFVTGASKMCASGKLTLTEFALSPTLLSGQAPEVPGFKVKRSCNTMGSTFACAHHRYERLSAWEQADRNNAPSVDQAAHAAPKLDLPPPPPKPSAAVAAAAAEKEIIVNDQGLAPVRAASVYLESKGPSNIDDEPTMLLDTGVLRRTAERWVKLLPRVEPFYAVKCNNHPTLLKTLNSMWAQLGVGGFDCASPAEMDLVTTAGCPDLAAKVVFANPCKQRSAISHAKKVGVRRVVFDNKVELDKLHGLYPDAELILRVQTDDVQAQCPLSNKFGCAPGECEALLEYARSLNLKVVGVSFHVGSGCSQVGAFRNALQRARDAFDAAERVGFRPTLLDIGGGFPGWDVEGEARFEDHAQDIREGLETLFPDPGVQVIAEPGRFFAASSQALLATVVAVAESSQGDRYYLNDGVYGSFNNLVYDHASVPTPRVLRDGVELPLGGGAGEGGETESARTCTIFGPTCDGFDLISDSISLPALRVGDSLLFENMGAYTSAASSSFNGFVPPRAFVYRSSLESSETEVARSSP
eukprot:TRINITY_DN31202_c0_g1_i1.p1 TRINITY_DN31202_c0_g1~~TRINITY_DN31202_c0_g1_i1.p1  ORF type:complete len:835 (-),score=177.80 TRINITY_DN31202_c0_g1_i1:139-2643(-)